MSGRLLAVTIVIPGVAPITLPPRRPGPTPLSTGALTDHRTPATTILLFGLDETDGFLAESQAGATLDLGVDTTKGASLILLASADLARLVTLTEVPSTARYDFTIKDGRRATLILELREDTDDGADFE